MVKLRDNIQEQLPFISVLHYGEDEYVGIIINQDQFVTSFYDLELIKIPISIFCRREIEPYRYAIKTFNSKDVRIILGPVVNLMNMTLKRVKRKSVQLVKTPKR